MHHNAAQLLCDGPDDPEPTLAVIAHPAQCIMPSTTRPCPTPWCRYGVPVHVLGRDSERRPAQPCHQARVEDDQVSVLPTLHAS